MKSYEKLMVSSTENFNMDFFWITPLSEIFLLLHLDILFFFLMSMYCFHNQKKISNLKHQMGKVDSIVIIRFINSRVAFCII